MAKIIENFMWEEPCISGDKGALAIFFSGCNLKCSFCQNKEISHIGKGEFYTPAQFRELILSYDLTKFSSIDLVTPTHFSSLLIEALSGLNLPIPIVWNSSGYEKVDMIEKVASIADVFLPDFKYFDSSLALSLSKAGDYFEIASRAVCKMRQLKPNNIFKEGVLVEGVLIRHLALPGQVNDSKKILAFIKENIKNPYISLMSQFIPLGGQIDRRLYPLEYKSLLSYASKLGLNDGYIQDFESADESFIPDF
ncbi:MAG: 4Fe-4S cluster-binding domain-containing protein [Clostridia bacterium]|nr:4Fe-4S cluster-binding domain-containing protein [Clostridia bacterium]